MSIRPLDSAPWVFPSPNVNTKTSGMVDDKLIANCVNTPSENLMIIIIQTSYLSWKSICYLPH